LLAAAPDYDLSETEAVVLIERQITTIADNWAEVCAQAELCPADGHLFARRQFLNEYAIERLDNQKPLKEWTSGQILWCVTRQDLFAAALAQAGLAADRVIYVETGDEKSLLASFEEGARHGGLGAVVAEVSRLSMTSSRRLHLAAEASGTMAIAVRRWRRQTEAAEFGQPTASVTRWRVSAVPSATLPVPGVGRARWLLELIRCRAGESADFIVDACDAQGRLDLPADLADRSHDARDGCRRV
jgi:protein ImuA